jgi:adenylate kinase
MTDSRPTTILFFGAPGSGKGTQGVVLGGLPGFFHLSSGEIFRSLDPDSEDGRAVAEHTSGGNLVPDDFTIALWQKKLASCIAEGTFDPTRQILLLDGIPRNIAQCELISTDVDVQLVLHLAGSDFEPLVQRILDRGLQQGRPDDADESVVRHRFTVYESDSTPVLDYYPDELLVNVDPIGLPGEVLGRVLDQVLPVQQRFVGSAVS